MLERRLVLTHCQIQTTFTPLHSQDPDDCPYDPRLGIAQQVHASIQTSRQNFADPVTNDPGYLNAVILHDLYPSMDENRTVWTSLATHMGPASVWGLGLSNVDRLHLEWICALHDRHLGASVRPIVVQNRFHQGNDYDAEVRATCRENHITYQAYGVRANSNMLTHKSSIVSVAEKAKVSREAALYGMVMSALGGVADDKVSLEVQVVNGTSRPARMAILEQVQQVLMDLNDAHWWIVAHLEQRQKSAAGRDQAGVAIDGTEERKGPEGPQGSRPGPSSEDEANLGARLGGGVYRLARHSFTEALRSED